MKKIVCIIFATTLFFCAAAQQHLTFMGMPINGTLDQFSKQAREKGLTYVQRVDGLDFYFGNYLGYDCVVGAISLEDKDLVYSVIACVILIEDWPSLKKTYLDVKKKLTAEYGKPKEVEENFLIHVSSDEERFKAVADDKCNYKASFVDKLGVIDVSISYMEELGPCVLIQFTDNENAVK